MKAERSHPLLIALGVAGLGLAGCGLVNGLGGPWPLVAGPGADGGPIIVPDGGDCPEGTHDAGDGTCLPEGECADGFVLEEDGRCSGWRTAPPPALSPARTLHTLSLLNDGRVLSVGGLAAGEPLPEGPAGLWRPGDPTWSTTAGNVLPRYGHTATALGGNRIIVVGGRGEDDAPVLAGELYRGDQDSWVELGELVYGRYGHQAVALTGGEFLALGGVGPTGAVLANVERLEGGAFTVIDASMSTARERFAAVVLDGDTVLVSGGFGGPGSPLGSVESWTLGDDAFIPRAAMTDVRGEHTATVLETGRVVVIGGLTEAGGELAPLRTIEVYDPQADSWSDLGQLTVPRWGHTATRLDDGRVLIAGGFGADDAPVDSVEILDPSAGAVVEAAPLNAARGHHPAVKLEDGSVLVVQGSFTADDQAAVTSSERYVHGS